MLKKQFKEWLNQLAKFRGGLLMECTMPLSDTQTEEWDIAIEHGFEHVKGTLLFVELLDEFENDPEQAWVNLMVRLDDASYYAIMAMPLLRQYLASSPRNPIASGVFCELNQNGSSLPTSLASLDEQRASYAQMAWNLAVTFKALREEFFSLSDLGSFLQWCIRFLILSGNLVSLAACVCGPKWRQMPIALNP